VVLAVACGRGEVPNVPAHVDEPHAADPLVPAVVRLAVPRDVLVVGDSEACAVGAVARATVQRLNDELVVPHDVVHVECRVGSTVQLWSSGLLRQALARHPSAEVVVVFLGTNHYGALRAPPVDDLLLQLGDRPCTWVGNVAVHGRAWPINAMLRRAVGDRCTYVDSEALALRLPDGVHPDRASAIAWLRAAWSTVPQRYEVKDEHDDER